MSRQYVYVPWPMSYVERLREQSRWDPVEFLIEGGSPPAPGAIEGLNAAVECYPEGIPMPEDWTSLEDPWAHVCWNISGTVALSLRRTTKIGVGDESGGAWGEELVVHFPLPEGVSLPDLLAMTKRERRQIRQTTADETDWNRRVAETTRRTDIIRAWANSREASTIPWGSRFSREPNRSTISDCLDALSSSPATGEVDERRTRWLDLVRHGLSIYPVAAPGLARLVTHLGLAEEIGVIP